MCGRTAQTGVAVQSAAATFLTAADSLAALQSRFRPSNNNDGAAAGATTGEQQQQQQEEQQEEDTQSYFRDNYNLSPGMDAIVFWKDNATQQIVWGRKVWGLVPRNGTATVPIPTGMAKHFNNLMFNARSDTLYEKPTFNTLTSSGKSCIIAVDGYFEWKTEVGKKQPYFVYRKNNNNNNNDNRPYLLLAGLWTQVNTGWTDEPTLDTFTILTTEVCEPIQWLHSRMPVILWDDALAQDWLQRPHVTTLHQQIVNASRQTPANVLAWHAVTTEMVSMKFRTIDAIKPLPKMKTVKSFFSRATTATATANNTATARAAAATTAASQTPSSVKKRKQPENTTVLDDGIVVDDDAPSEVVTVSTSSTTASSSSTSQSSSQFTTTNSVSSSTSTSSRGGGGGGSSTTRTQAPSTTTRSRKVTKSSPSRSIDSYFQRKSPKK